jgi:metallo-beta-lactamase family protein
MNARIRFYGATREVTGSMHIIEANGYTVALDCGLFQGKRSEANEKNRRFPCPPSKIDAVVLSHAHIDHCGKLPRLVREGFEGLIYATPPTRDLVEILLADSAHIQEEDTAYWNKKRVRRGDAPIEPLYDAGDVLKTLPLLHQQRLDAPFEVAPGVRATLCEAGHMLGSSYVLLEIDTGKGQTVRVCYSGDIGRPGIAILRDPAPLPECDYLICESTYGGRDTPRNDRMEEQLAEVINDVIDRGGKLIIPAFAVGRTQTIVYHFQRLGHSGGIRRWIPLIVDSPLASAATQIFRKHPEIRDREAVDFRAEAGPLFRGKWCEYTRSVEDSKALHDRKEPMIIVSASGMCEVGRILHHLKNNIEDPNSAVLIVGYQAAHTLGRRLIEGQKTIKIFGEEYKVRAKVRVLNGFSAHANAGELADMTTPLAKRVRKACLVHGELEQAEAMAAEMRRRGFRDVLIPERNQLVELDGR